MDFWVGNIVLLKLSKEQFNPPTCMAGALMQRLEGPFEIVEKVGKVAYKLKLLEHLSIFHPVFHVSQLRGPISSMKMSGARTSHLELS